MDEKMTLEVLGSVQLIASLVLGLTWSFFRNEWWSIIFGILAIFFLVEAVWHYAVCDVKRHFLDRESANE